MERGQEVMLCKQWFFGGDSAEASSSTPPELRSLASQGTVGFYSVGDNLYNHFFPNSGQIFGAPDEYLYDPLNWHQGLWEGQDCDGGNDAACGAGASGYHITFKDVWHPAHMVQYCCVACI